MNRLVLIALIVLTGGLTIFLFWPLSSDKFEIKTDANRIAAKKNFLQSIDKSTDKSHPNILFIVVDDLGIADLSLYKNGFPDTPHIDALGASGIVFENAYVTAPMCSPSRAAMLAGRYQQRFGFDHQIRERYLSNRLEYLAFKYFVNSYPWLPIWTKEVPTQSAIAAQGIPPSEILLPELLKKSGYTTAMIGKWNLGNGGERTPCNFGFDYQFGFYSTHSLYAPAGTPGIHDQPIPNDFTDSYIWKDQRKNGHGLFRNCQKVEENGYLTDVFTDEAISYMASHTAEPVFLYLSYNAPHTPLQAPEKYMTKFSDIKDPVKRTYYAMISSLDDNLGRLFSSLESVGLDKRTMIFFISDNGGAEYTLTTVNGDYKGGKMTNFEGGIRVPFVFSWKNHLDAMRYTPMVSSMDIFQTIIEEVGIPLPTDRKYDGVNLMPFLTGKKTSDPHEYLCWQIDYNKAILSDEWKLIINTKAQDTLLFNLREDTFESTDLHESQQHLVKKLADIHAAWSGQMVQPLWPPMIEFHYKDNGKEYYFSH